MLYNFITFVHFFLWKRSICDASVTMEIAGHRDIKSTVRYAKARESAVASALEALGYLIRRPLSQNC
jgi:hypothetical protein